METEVVVSAEITEVAFLDATVLVVPEDNYEVLVETDAEILITQEAIEILALEAAPAWTWSTKITVSSTPPVNPRLGDVWIVKA